MYYMSKTEYETQLKKIQKENETKQRLKSLKTERNKFKKRFNMPSTSKMILWVVILFSLQIVFFIEYCMIKYGDFSATYALIGIPTTIIPTILGYFYKSKAENTQGGIVYESAMMGNSMNEENDVEENDDEALG